MTIRDLQTKYGLKADDFWEMKRGKKSIWIITHDACEKIAAKEKIETVDIQCLSSEWNFCRFLVKMKKADKTETTVGEALLNSDEVVSKKMVAEWKHGKPTGNQTEKVVYKGNCESQYIGSMAEKRGKDRCILKLINAYEYGIYSDTESDAFKKSNQTVADKLQTKLSFEAQVEAAQKGELKCLECASPVVVKEGKDGSFKLYCEKDWKHKRFISKAEHQELLKKSLNKTPF